jgi:hypothetical protein
MDISMSHSFKNCEYYLKKYSLIEQNQKVFPKEGAPIDNLLLFAIQLVDKNTRVGIGKNSGELEETCEPGKIHVSKEYYDIIKNDLQQFLHRIEEMEEESYMIDVFSSGYSKISF